MKTHHKNHLVISLMVGILISFLFATTVYALTTNYYGLTTINYTNRTTDQGGWNWNGGYIDWTNPSWSMDQFGLTFWSTWCSCNNVRVDASYIGYSNPPNTWMMQYNKTSIADGMAQTKVQCPPNQTLRGHVYIQHWWQDSGRPGDGRTLNTSAVLTRPP